MIKFRCGQAKTFASDFGKANWKDNVLKKLFTHICIEEAHSQGKRGGSLNSKSYDMIGNNIKEQKTVAFSQGQLKNH